MFVSTIALAEYAVRDRIANLPVENVEKADPIFGNDFLKNLVRLEGQGHFGGIGADQNRVRLENQVDRFIPEFGLLVTRQGRQPMFRTLTLEQFHVSQPLGRMDAGQRNDRFMRGKYRSDSGMKTTIGSPGERMLADDSNPSRHRLGVFGHAFNLNTFLAANLVIFYSNLRQAPMPTLNRRLLKVESGHSVACHSRSWAGSMNCREPGHPSLIRLYEAAHLRCRG